MAAVLVEHISFAALVVLSRDVVVKALCGASAVGNNCIQTSSPVLV